MVSVGTRECGKRDFLPHGRDLAQIPFGAGEGALGILAVDPQDGEAVGLDHDFPARDRAGQDEACVERRKRDWDLFLDIVDAQPLECPAGNRDVAGAVDPFDIDEVAQHIVAADVVAAGDSLVGCGAQRPGDAPVRIELELAIGFEITAEIAPLVEPDRIGIGIVDPPVGDEGADLIGAEAGQVAEPPLERGQGLGVDMRRDRQVAIGREAEIIRDRQLEPVGARERDVRDERAGYAARSVAAGADTENRKQRQGDAEQADPPAGEADPVGRRILHHARGDDLPAGIFGAAGRRCYRAGRIDRIFERGDAADAGAPGRRDAPAAFQHHQQIVDHPVAQRIGQRDPLADQFVALGIDHHDIALGLDLAGLAVPGDPVGGEIIAVAVHPHLARGGDQIGFAIVFGIVGAEIDPLFGGGGRWLGHRRGRCDRRRHGRCKCIARARFGRLFLRGEADPRPCQQDRQRGPAQPCLRYAQVDPARHVTSSHRLLHLAR